MKIEVSNYNDPDWDHENIDIKDKYKGYGYIDKANGSCGLQRCPACGNENYALMVARGICGFCRFNLNIRMRQAVYFREIDMPTQVNISSWQSKDD